MPSYIELNKNTSFPSASLDKAIIGINNSGSLVITNDSGSTSTISSPPYKVYTALLTQSGGGRILDQTSGTLTVGVSYQIDTYQEGDDFSNVGGPAAAVGGAWDGYWFVATGTTPANYSNGSLLLYNTGAPVVTVLENTIGNVWFEYMDVGYYKGFSQGLFLENKTVILTGVSTLLAIFQAVWNDEDPNNSIFLTTLYSYGFGQNITSNGVIYNAPIEIRVYN